MAAPEPALDAAVLAHAVDPLRRRARRPVAAADVEEAPTGEVGQRRQRPERARRRPEPARGPPAHGPEDAADDVDVEARLLRRGRAVARRLHGAPLQQNSFFARSRRRRARSAGPRRGRGAGSGAGTTCVGSRRRPRPLSRPGSPARRRPSRSRRRPRTAARGSPRRAPRPAPMQDRDPPSSWLPPPTLPATELIPP